MNKRELILDTMLELLREGSAGTASVSDIAKRAGIAKGGMYYYFKSKEEVIDALVDRQYSGIIESCRVLVENSDKDALSKLELLLKSYRGSYFDNSIDVCLHTPENASIHQKSLAKILVSLSPIISGILEQGVREKTFVCDYPQQYSEIIMSVFTFLLDPGIFSWTPAELALKMKAFADLLEKGLHAKKGSFAFLYTG